MTKDVIGFEGYYKVDESGNVYNAKTGRIKKQPVHWKGYSVVTLRKPGICKTFRTHRLVAEAFIPKVDGLNQVNHKNGIKTDNRLENLEWCNNSQNQLHSIRLGLRKMKTGVDSARNRLVVHKEMGVFMTLKDAAFVSGLSESQFGKMIRGSQFNYTNFMAA
jgi:HNH endonuclease/NUMOD4 motif